MNINVTGEMEEYLNGVVQAGEYASYEEAVEAALRLQRDIEVLYSIPAEELNRAIEPAIEQVNRGEVKPFEDVIRELKQMRAAKS
jgi:putative addiction module CopG family antidote